MYVTRKAKQEMTLIREHVCFTSFKQHIVMIILSRDMSTVTEVYHY